MAAPAIAENNNAIIVPTLDSKVRDDAALKLEDEEVAAAAAVGVVAVPEPAGVIVLPEAEAVTPKAELEAGVAIEVALSI
jgi:translation initiation factor 6 (eIF-6)